MRDFYPKHQTDIEQILKKAPLSNDVFLSIINELYTAYSLAEITERELKRNREQYSIHYKRKADEYEAKAKAFDQIKTNLTEDLRKLEKLEKDFPLSCRDEMAILNNILVLMDEYESGESDEMRNM